MEKEITAKPIAEKEQHIYPILPLRDMVMYPYMLIPLFVGRQRSIKALEVAITEGNKKIFLIAQKDSNEDQPTIENLYQVGTVANILQLLKLPDGTVKVLAEGMQRASVKKFISYPDYLAAEIELFEPPSKELLEKNEEIPALQRTLLERFQVYLRLNKKLPIEILSNLENITEIEKLADTIAAHLYIKIVDKQEILEIQTLSDRLEKLLQLLENEINLLKITKRIRLRVKNQMEKNQQEYYLREQLNAIHKELSGSDADTNEITELMSKIEKAGMPKEVYKKAQAELHRLKIMPPMSAEATVVRNYLDCLINVPWKKASKVSYNLKLAEKILEADHFGLEKVKERILEYLAVQGRVKKLKGAILCLVGPPGVGKTSLGQSIAKATGRKFVRMSLGGVRDEAEIRGHRRTYIASMPGSIIQKLTKAGVRNPLFLLDEIDKMAMDFRGDPTAALLEVLDPEQNNTFNDHYLEVDYDLSDVMFIATANSLDIPTPLLDRMEIIRIAGYTEHEKIEIAERYLIPKQLKVHGLKAKELEISQAAVRDIIRYYTREAGVRNLEREIAKICRKVVRQHPELKKAVLVHIYPRSLEKYLGVKRFRYGIAEKVDQIGQVTGLAWTEVGGEILTIEAAMMPGKGKFEYTGQLGDVMQESIQAALTVVRSRSAKLGISAKFYETHDLHIHMPEGATPKDGPSAGIGMCTALVSAITQIPVKADVAMTGEITLRGEVLPIGGLKEKLLAAQRGRIKHVIIPLENERDLKDIPKEVLQGLTLHPVRWIDQVLELALPHMPTAHSSTA